MADFLDAVGSAVSNRFSNRANDMLNIMNNPSQYMQNRVDEAAGVNTTSTQYQPKPAAGKRAEETVPEVPGAPAIAPLPSPSVMPEVSGPAKPNVNASAYGVGAQSGRRYAADQNNPSGLGWNGKNWNAYDTPEEGVMATENQVGRYLEGKGPLKGPATPEAVVSTWVTGGKTPAEKIQNGAYLGSVKKSLSQAGVQLNEDGTIPNTPEARKAITSAIVNHETLPQHRTRFAPFLMGGQAVKPTAATPAQARPAFMGGQPGFDEAGTPIQANGMPGPAVPGAPEVTPAGTTPEYTGPGIGEGASPPAASPYSLTTPGAGAPGLRTQEGLNLEQLQQRQKHLEDINSGDPTRLLALSTSNDPMVAATANNHLYDYYKHYKMSEDTKAAVDDKLSKGEMPNINKKGEEGSYIKAYLFARLGLDDLAKKEQELISPTRHTMPVMLGATPYQATYNKSGELLYAFDEAGKKVDSATLSKIGANAVTSKGAHQAPNLISDPFGIVKGNWVLETRPGGMPVFKEVGTGRIATQDESAQLSKASQRGDILSTARTQANHATTTEYNRLAKERDARLQRGATDETLKPLGLDLESIQTRSQQAGQHILNAAMSNFSALPQGGRTPTAGSEFKPVPANAPAAGETPPPVTTTPGTSKVLDSWEKFKPGETTANYDKRTQYSKDDIEAEAQQLVSGDKTLTEITGRDAGLLRHYASARAKELDPSWSATDATARRDALKKWTNPDSSVSKQVRSHITAANSISDVRDAYNALQNGNTPLFNEIRNSFREKTGSDLPVNAKTGAMLLGPEIIKSIIPGGGGVTERLEAQHLMGVNLSPDQAKAVFKTLEDFQGNSLKALETDWTRAKLPKDQFRERVLGGSPAAQELYDRASQHQNNRAAASAGLPGAPNKADVEAEMRRRGLIK
jgi:hypothetical protein